MVAFLRRAGLVSALSVAFALGVAQRSQSEDLDKPRYGGVLRVLLLDEPLSASIHEEVTATAAVPFGAIYNNLVAFDPSARQNSLDAIIPELATSWSWNHDGTALTFKLREGVQWHDGLPFSSADVKCTWDMLKDASEHKLERNPRKAWYSNLKDVTVDGPRDVTFHLARRQPSFLMLLAGAFSPVYPCHRTVDQMRRHPIGTGPFRLSTFVPGRAIVLDRNPNYWRHKRPYLDRIVFFVERDPASWIPLFTSGQFDLTFPGSVAPVFERQIQLQEIGPTCEMQPTNTQVNLLINRDKPPFNNASLRLAVELALDRQALIDVATLGKGKMGGTMLPEPAGLWGLPADILKGLPGFNPDAVEKSRQEARELLARSGYTADNPLKIQISTRGLPRYLMPAAILSNQLKKVNIEAQIEVLGTTNWYQRLSAGAFTVGLNVQAVAIDDPDAVFYETFGCGSERDYTQYCNEAMQTLFDQQSATLGRAERRRLVWEIDRILQSDGARPVLYHESMATCWHRHVHGVRVAANSIYNNLDFENIWLSARFGATTSASAIR